MLHAARYEHEYYRRCYRTKTNRGQDCRGLLIPVFGVQDITVARKDLESAGVEFDGDTEVIEGMVSTATFYDPDRNAMMLAQDLTSEGQ